MTFVLLSEKICISLSLKDSLSITPEPNVTIHLIPVCMCVGMIAEEWLDVCVVSSMEACVWAVVRALFFVTWLDCTSDKGDTHFRELPLFLCLKQCSAMRRKSDHFGRCEITIYHENDRQTNWEEHISNMPPYASDTF